ncbi:MAG: hypothetical protein WC187_08610, partial [Bacillota bacterium]
MQKIKNPSLLLRAGYSAPKQEDRSLLQLFLDSEFVHLSVQISKGCKSADNYKDKQEYITCAQPAIEVSSRQYSCNNRQCH